MSARRNLSILIYAQAVLGSQMPIHIILGGLAGARLAESPALATLPISVIVLVSMLTAPLASLLMGRFGRKTGFLLATLAGASGGALAVRALLVGDFATLLLGSACTGVYQSFQGFFRFAAAETTSPEQQPKAISWVLAGGLVSALIGPEIVQLAGDALAPVPYAGPYAAIVGINVLGAVGLAFLRIPRPAPVANADRGRPLAVILRDPKIVAAMLCAMVSYAVMNLVMTSTPLAMVAHGFNAGHAADVVRWHVLAMFAPSFFTGHVIARFGHLRVIGCGLALLAGCAAIALTGTEIHKFYGALIALGLGWNFGFIGATSLLTTAHAPSERAKVQGLNDFLVFGLVATASFASGALLNAFGWNAVQLAVLPALLIAVAAMSWLKLVRAPSAVALARAAPGLGSDGE